MIRTIMIVIVIISSEFIFRRSSSWILKRAKVSFRIKSLSFKVKAGSLKYKDMESAKQSWGKLDSCTKTMVTVIIGAVIILIILLIVRRVLLANKRKNIESASDSRSDPSDSSSYSVNAGNPGPTPAPKQEVRQPKPVVKAPNGRSHTQKPKREIPAHGRERLEQRRQQAAARAKKIEELEAAREAPPQEPPRREFVEQERVEVQQGMQVVEESPKRRFISKND